MGNQLFQLGAALRLTKGEIENIRLNVEHLGNRSFELNKWISDTNLPICISKIAPQMLLSANKAYIINDPVEGPYADQKALDTNIDTANVDVILDGYFQSGFNLQSLKQHVMHGARASLNKIYRLCSEVTSKKCSIHYRTGDYENRDVQQTLGMINLSYVDRVISILHKHYDQIEIFSEPNDLLQAYSEKKELALHLNLTAEEVFSRLLTSETIAICNSSFSLTAACLSRSVKTIFRPARWSRKYATDSLTESLGIDVRYISNTFFQIN